MEGKRLRTSLAPTIYNRMHHAVRSVFIKWLGELGDFLNNEYSLFVDAEMRFNKGYQEVEIGLVPFASLNPICVVHVAYNEPRSNWEPNAQGLVLGTDNDCRVAIVVEINERQDPRYPAPPEEELWSSLPFMHRHQVDRLAETIQDYCLRKDYRFTGRVECKVHVVCLRWTEALLLWECEMVRGKIVSVTEHDEDGDFPDWRNLLSPEWTVKKKFLLPYRELLKALKRNAGSHNWMAFLEVAAKKKEERFPPIEECKECKLCEKHSAPFEYIRDMMEGEDWDNKVRELQRKKDESKAKIRRRKRLESLGVEVSSSDTDDSSKGDGFETEEDIDKSTDEEALEALDEEPDEETNDEDEGEQGSDEEEGSEYEEDENPDIEMSTE